MYDHYIAVDWAQSNMAIARMTTKSHNIKTTDTKSDVGDLRAYLNSLICQSHLKEQGLIGWMAESVRMNRPQQEVCEKCGLNANL